MDWDTLFAVVIGGLIAIIPTIINNVYQERRHKEDRAEQRREAKVQLELELTKNAIQEIEDSIKNTLKSFSEMIYIASSGIAFQSNLLNNGILTKDEYLIKSKSYFERLDTLNKEVLQEMDTISKLGYSFDDETSTEYESYARKLSDYFQSANLVNQKIVIDVDAWFEVKKNAGAFQRTLKTFCIII